MTQCRDYTKDNPKNRGWALWELLIALTLTAACAFYPVNIWLSYLNKREFEQNVHQLAQALTQTRLLAQTQQIPHRLQIDDKGNWQVIAQDTLIIQSSKPAPCGFKGFLNNHSLIFLPQGMMYNNGHFACTNSQGITVIKLWLNQLGRLRIETIVVSPS